MLHHLAPTGRAGIVLAAGSMSSSQNSEGEIRAAMVDADVVEVMIALLPDVSHGTFAVRFDADGDSASYRRRNYFGCA